MSRYVLKNTPEIKIVVGYDNPLQTFFVQVIDVVKEEADMDDCFLLWAGTKNEEITTTQDLELALSPFLEAISVDVKEKLQRDYDNRTKPTKLQSLAARWMSEFGG